MWPFKTICRIIVRTLKWLYAFVPFGQFVVWFINWKPLALYHKCKSIMGWSNGKNQGSNSEMNFVGLNNQGATCYLNTLLQTWFMTREVKDCISRSHSPDLLIVALKELFEQLTSEQTNSVCTKKLTTCLQLDVSKQNDIEVCFRSLMSNLSTRMVEENNILKIYQVTMVHSMKCSECKELFDNETLFLDIPLSMCLTNTFVKFKCMEESLGAFLSVETMEGDNKCYCDVCGEKTESTSRYYFKKLPQILTFQLKRFELDYNYMQYRKIKDRINLPSDLEFIKSQDDYNEWRLNLPVNKEKLMEDSENSVDNPDVQRQFELVLRSIKVDKNPGPDGIPRTQLSEVNNSGNNTSLGAMKQGQNELSTLQGQEKYSVNDEERTTEAPGQSEQDSTDGKETHASSKCCDEVTGGEQSSTSLLQGQSGNSENCEGGTSEAVQDQLEQISTEDKENHPQNECCHEATKEGPSSISTLNMSKVNSADCEEKTSESAQDQSARDSTEQKDNYAPYKCRYEDTKEGQSPISTPHKQKENDEEREEGMLRAAQDQSEQDSAEKKIIQSKCLPGKRTLNKDKHHHNPKMCKLEIVSKEKKYELFAIWHHLGSYGGGHYYAEIKSGSGDWYTFDDTHVKKIGKNITLSSTTAYMVLYRLIDTNKEAESDATTPEQCQTQKPTQGIQESKHSQL